MKVTSPASRRTTLLALIPLAVGLLLGALVMPRAVLPGEIPLPAVDARALARRIAGDHELAEHARREPLDANVRALGTALRTFNRLEARGASAAELSAARGELDTGIAPALEVGGIDGLLRLRAVELEEFLAEVKRFEATGSPSQELDEVAGTFVQGMVRAGWCRDRRGAPAAWPPDGKPVVVLLDEPARRAAYKRMWTTLLGLEGQKGLALGLDEERALYSFYFRHAHAPETQRVALAAARRQATDADVCARIDEGERVAAWGWLLTKMKELAAVDPTYPLGYARGIALYHRHEYGLAAQAFRDWSDAHPDGPWSLRARNYLIETIRADRQL